MSIAHQEAAPMSLADIERVAWRLRQAVGATEVPWLDVERVLEHALPLMFGDEAHFNVREIAEMGGNHALADPDEKVILIRSDVYNGLCDHRGRDRMTIMHEFGHLILHAGARLARRMAREPPPPYRCPEWQAKAFGGAVMMPAPLIPDPWAVDEHFVAREFGVSVDAARTRLQQLRKRTPQK